MEGELVKHISADLFGLSVHLDTLMYTWLTMAVILIFAWTGTRHMELVPSGTQNILEGLVEYFQGLAAEMLGSEGKKVAPYLFTIFLFVMLSNMWGLVPKMTSPTNDLNTTFGIALISSLGVYVIGVSRKGLGYFKHFFKPLWFMFPFNLLDELIRPFTLAIRLFVNIFVGEVLLEVLTHLCAPYIPIPAAWLLMSVLIGLIQAYVFTLLSTVYLIEAFSEEH